MNNSWAPFASKIDWEVVRWAKLHGPGSTAFSGLLQIDGLVDTIGLSFKNSKQLNDIVDKQLPNPHPKFNHREIKIAGQSFDLFSCDVIECIKALYGDPEHKQCLYHEMNTGDWWWTTQEKLEAQKPGTTIVPIIISSDKTQLTLFQNKTVYLVYLTIRNLPKSICRKPSCCGQILLAYLPTTKLAHIKNKSSRRRTLTNLFHASMKFVLSPLKEPGIHGIKLTSGDGATRRCHPIYATYVGDYPEQCLVTGVITGDCPICECPHNELGLYPSNHPKVHLKLLHDPFWQDLPYTNIYSSITPDILHQLHQGVMKHLISWLVHVCGPDEINVHVKCLPPNHSICIFYKGITSLSRISGTEHKQIASFLLGILPDIPLHGEQPPSLRAHLICAMRALLDFLYLAQYTIHSDDTLRLLEQSLEEFHLHKSVFEQLGARKGFNIPKLHSLVHYARRIKRFETTDNYSTESTERLHIDFAKDAYKATNHKDEFPQMTSWLKRREKIQYHEKFIQWRLDLASQGMKPRCPHSWKPPDMALPLHYKMTKHPTVRAVSFNHITSLQGYSATHFVQALSQFILFANNPSITVHDLEQRASTFSLPFNSVPVYHVLKFINTAIHPSDTLDSIHANPGHNDGITFSIVMPRFDTALVRVSPIPPTSNITSPLSSMIGLRVGQVRVLFSLPITSQQLLFPHGAPSEHFAYIEWFSTFEQSPIPNLQMYKVSPELHTASIVPVSTILQSVHLSPKWGSTIPAEWTSWNVLDQCSMFFLNPYKDHHTYYNTR
ncbi:hypothetical protein BDN71DRAFT_1481608 [Pleurotus eryngii]|uniref:Uncharacterized protein n=1 Tax=Pleurotus eryngii TaxID=5323 RepID=A0A9P6DID1_PLEER|nr:hypothetical protein BDN71DRAFT_1481608 [Pleurotus eryngii]